MTCHFFEPQVFFNLIVCLLVKKRTDKLNSNCPHPTLSFLFPKIHDHHFIQPGPIQGSSSNSSLCFPQGSEPGGCCNPILQTRQPRLREGRMFPESQWDRVACLSHPLNYSSFPHSKQNMTDWSLTCHAVGMTLGQAE